jgi:hypothetical protein
MKRITSRSNHIEFSQNARRIIVENVCLSINCCVTHSCFNLFEISLYIRDFSDSLLSLLVINLHSLRMVLDMFVIHMRYLIWICNWFKCKLMKTTCVSTFKIEIEITRNNSKILRKQRFCMIESLLIVLDFSSWACVKWRRHKWESNEQRRCVTLESFEKSFFKWRSTFSYKSWFVSFFLFWIFRTCESQFNRVSICTLKIWMSFFD